MTKEIPYNFVTAKLRIEIVMYFLELIFKKRRKARQLSDSEPDDKMKNKGEKTFSFLYFNQK